MTTPSAGTTCARNLPQHFNGCACTVVPGAVLAEVTDIDLDTDGFVYPSGDPRPYARLNTPEEETLPDGTTVTNYMAAPADTSDGIFGYGGSANPTPMSWVEDELPGIPGKAYHFGASVGARDGAILMTVSGEARSHAEAWDRMGPPQAAWAAKYDRRPDTTRATADPQTLAAIAKTDEETARRLGAADELNDAIAARKALRGPAIFGRRRKVVEANARIDAAWEAYQEAYPYATPKKKG